MWKVDRRNRRLLVTDSGAAPPAAVRRWLDLAAAEGLGKVLVYARPGAWLDLLALGFALEGVLHRWFGDQAAMVMARFPDRPRGLSAALPEEAELLEAVLAEGPAPPPPVPRGFTLRPAGPGDVPALAQLYRQVFSVYPSPIADPAYLADCLSNHPFYLVAHRGRVVAAASAEVNGQHPRGELTDCATLPGYRGRGLMSCLLAALNGALAGLGVSCRYSLARARSAGMNRCLRRLGYRYGGRLTNNCVIAAGESRDGEYEDMNLWVWPG